MRRRTLSYADAARLMGGVDDKLVRLLDTALGGLLLTATFGTSELAISLFDAKSELTKLNEQALRTLGERREGLGRLDRSDRMAAAQVVLATSAFFEALAEADLPFRPEVLELERARQVGIVTGAGPGGDRLADVATMLQEMRLPVLSPTGTLAAMETWLLPFYGDAATLLTGYVQGLAVWDEMSETQRDAVASQLADDVPGAAVRIWRAGFRRLAAEFPELAFYVDRADHEATRREVSTGLAALGERLRSLEAAPHDFQRAGLTRHYQAELDRAIVDSGDVPEYLSIPTLREGYVDPDFRAAAVSTKDRIHLEEFWSRQAVHDDLDGFLAAFLSSPQAAYQPLLVLGQPGAGKSVLTKFLAGKLPAGDFVVVRVVLRQAPADGDVQTQVEDAVRRATGERGNWPALSRSAGDALRVVILDGFDELLQSTGVGTSAYLRDVVRFQEREADQGRPVAVVVTSRMAVADRALLPAEGAVAVRLEPFRDEQIQRWLTVWNGRNAAGLAARELSELPVAAVLAHRDLAGQPLLLLMLALYDADDNGLQRDAGDLSRPDLYERLLDRFARREVAKEHPDLGENEVTAAVREEMHRLSIAAMAMFHRGRQWVTQAELDLDLKALLGEPAARRDDFRTPTTPGAAAVGRFFFVHRTRSRRAGEELEAVEFLHATFGEYLVARAVMNELRTMVLVAELELPGVRAPEPNPDLLLAALGFTPLTMRDTVIDALTLRLGELPAERRARLRGLALKVFRSVVAGSAGPPGAYEPVAQTPAGRQAMQSLNLMLLAVLSGEETTAKELFGIDGDPVDAWRSLARLWQSQCSAEGWQSLVETVQVSRLGSRADRDLQLVVRPERWVIGRYDPLWSSRYEDSGHEPVWGWREGHTGSFRMPIEFLQDTISGTLFEAVARVDSHPDGGMGLSSTYALVAPDESLSATRALVDLWTASAMAPRFPWLPRAYEVCLDVLGTLPPQEWRDRDWFLTLLLRQAAADRAHLSKDLLKRLWDACLVLSFRAGEASAELLYWAEQALGPDVLQPLRSGEVPRQQ